MQHSGARLAHALLQRPVVLNYRCAVCCCCWDAFVVQFACGGLKGMRQAGLQRPVVQHRGCAGNALQALFSQ